MDVDAKRMGVMQGVRSAMVFRSDLPIRRRVVYWEGRGLGRSGDREADLPYVR